MAPPPTTDRARPALELPVARNPHCPFDPAAALLALHTENPVTRVRIWDGSTPWLVTRHADQRALLADPRVSIDEKLPGFPHMTQARAEFAKVTPPLVSNTDAPVHTHLRRMISGRFLVKRIEAMRPDIQRIVDDLIDAMVAGPKPADLVTALALPAPTLVICNLLGVPYRDHAFFQHNSNTVISSSAPPEEVLEASEALGGYLGDLIEQKMTEPADDMLSDLAALVKFDQLTYMEAVCMGVAVLIAGYETTANMISLGTLALLQHPDQLAALREMDDLREVAGAVDELLRYLTVVHIGLGRIAREDIEIGGQIIRAGDGIVFDLPAANRDSAIFVQPAKLDVHRAPRYHQAFGFGPHQCLGQSLARVELQVVYRTLFRRLPTLRLACSADQIEFSFEGLVYGVRSLLVTW